MDMFKIVLIAAYGLVLFTLIRFVFQGFYI